VKDAEFLQPEFQLSEQALHTLLPNLLPFTAQARTEKTVKLSMPPLDQRMYLSSPKRIRSYVRANYAQPRKAVEDRLRHMVENT
jgi:hypothetical protein